MVQGFDSDEVVFWNNNDGGQGFSAAEAESRNPLLNPNISTESSPHKRIKPSSSDSSPQEREQDVKSFAGKSSLGLMLRKTPSFVNLVQMKLSEARSNSHSSTQTLKKSGRRPKMDDSGSGSVSEKLKASNFPALLLKIGSWERISRHEGDLIAKCYFAKKKIVWEVLEKALKRKIEVQWSDIEGIRATICEGEPGILEIELNQPPLFFQEINPEPRKHTIWDKASDFTAGQALIYRRHFIKFPPGAVDKHYQKLLQCDRRLFELSRRPFPRLESPFFCSNTCGRNNSISFDGSSIPLQVPPGLHCRPLSAVPSPALAPPDPARSFKLAEQPFGNVNNSVPVQSFKPAAAGQPFGIVNSNVVNSVSPMSVMEFPRRDANICNYVLENQGATHAREGQIQPPLPLPLPLPPPSSSVPAARMPEIQEASEDFSGEDLFHVPGCVEEILGDIDLLNELRFGCSDEMNSVTGTNPQNDVGMNLEFGRQNFSDDRSFLGTTEPSDVNAGLFYPEPLCRLPPNPNGSNENLIVHNLTSNDSSYYPFDFSNPKANHQWR